jgi:hypothetical protein
MSNTSSEGSLEIEENKQKIIEDIMGLEKAMLAMTTSSEDLRFRNEKLATDNKFYA